MSKEGKVGEMINIKIICQKKEVKYLKKQKKYIQPKGDPFG